MLLREHKGSLIKTPAALAEILRTFLGKEDTIGQDREHFWSVGLDTKKSLKYAELVSLGTLDASLVHPREVFRNAVHKGASVLVTGHNHPSGNLQPSLNDRRLMEKLKAAGELLGIPVIDHVIIGPVDGSGFYSFNQQGLL